jgi:AAA+ superfamily predicted ATPase
VTTAWQDLRTTLARLDLRLRLGVEANRALLADRARDPFLGLRITEADVNEILSATPPADVAEQLLDGRRWPTFARLQQLVDVFRLDGFEEDALLVCLAAELDVGYGRLYAYLQDDGSHRWPTIDLILRLLCRSFDERMTMRDGLGPRGRLLRHQLLVPVDAPTPQPLIAQALRVDERILAYLLGADDLDRRLEPFTRLHRPTSLSGASMLPRSTRDALAVLLSRGTTGALPGPIVYLHGALGTGKLGAARTMCRDAQRSLLAVDVAALLHTGAADAHLVLLTREALLQDAVIAFENFDRLLAEMPDAAAARAQLGALLEQRFDATLLLGDRRWEPASWLPNAATLRVELPAPPPSARLELWRSHVDGQLPGEHVAELAARYHLDGDGIQAVISAAWGQAVWRGDGTVQPDDFRAAARAITAPHLDGMARRIVPRYGWEDIVLTRDGAATLRELCDRARHHETVLERWGFGQKHARRAGMTALFAGPPGTGKTMAAEVVAGALGLELFRIDLAGVVSKYIGETEKNLEQIFRDADQGDAVLLFDEADALFGKRSEVRDAHDRYANVEIAYLLQRLESYDGLAILTTNLRGNLDEAFVRRLEFVLEFPLPEEPERLAIWRRALPPEAPLAPDADLSFLARKFRLAGGHIRNIALAAAFLAAAEQRPIGMRHLARATRREHQKLGKLVNEADFEGYGAVLREDP